MWLARSPSYFCLQFMPCCLSRCVGADEGRRECSGLSVSKPFQRCLSRGELLQVQGFTWGSLEERSMCVKSEEPTPDLLFIWMCRSLIFSMLLRASAHVNEQAFALGGKGAPFLHSNTYDFSHTQIPIFISLLCYFFKSWQYKFVQGFPPGIAEEGTIKPTANRLLDW